MIKNAMIEGCWKKMNFTIENLEFFLLILVRMSGFIFSAPFYSLSNVPRRVQVGLSVFLSVLLFNTMELYTLEYTGVIGYARLVVVELFIGIIIGYMTNICIYILNFAGQIIDMEIGFSMVNVMNPAANMTSTVTGTMYTYFVMLALLATDIYRYILIAMMDAFQFIPVGKAVFRISIYSIMVTFIKDYFILGFRIVLPVFAAMLMVNVVLGVLAKVAPQMNMFVIGMQLKVFVGLVILCLAGKYIPDVAEMVYSEMKTMVNEVIKVMAP